MTIETNIPIPPKRRFIPDGRLLGFLKQLQLGDSFVSNRSNIHTTAFRAGITLVSRRVSNGKVRWWRVCRECEEHPCICQRQQAA